MKIIQKYVYKARFYMIFTGCKLNRILFPFYRIFFIRDLDFIIKINKKLNFKKVRNA